MVEYTPNTDRIFESLADKTRRDILITVSEDELTISEIALSYDMSFAAIAKHIEILEVAGLVAKRKDGKKRYVSMIPGSIEIVKTFINNIDYGLLNKPYMV